MRYAYSLIRDDRAKYPHHIAGFHLPCIKWYLDHQVAGGRGCPRILGRSAFCQFTITVLIVQNTTWQTPYLDLGHIKGDLSPLIWYE